MGLCEGKVPNSFGGGDRAGVGQPVEGGGGGSGGAGGVHAGGEGASFGKVFRGDD